MTASGLRLPAAFRAALRNAVVGLAAALALSGCAARLPPKPPATPTEVPDQLTLVQGRFADLPGWGSDASAEALPALRLSCGRLARIAADRAIGPDDRLGKGADWAPPCAALARLPTGDNRAIQQFIEEWFTPWLAGNNGKTEGLFTGYYESSLRGSRTRQGRYQTPLYRRPGDLVMVELGEFRPNLKGERIAGRVVDGKLKPYADRKSIDRGSLKNQGLELLFVDDPVDAFFLHIQGSGRVTLPDGTELRIGYDGQNGHPYIPIGRELVSRGALNRDEVSMQSIRAWLTAHPDQVQDLLWANPSYVFFRLLEGDGSIGGQGVALTPGRSLAIDRSLIAYGLPVWLDAADPLDPAKRLRRLMVTQDTGGAIRGPVRGDVFWGHGAEAEERAGRMKSQGRYWLFLPKPTVAG
jgi:membrane-bound lytic murein transglycosylase A